jgi:hypothetical protein
MEFRITYSRKMLITKKMSNTKVANCGQKDRHLKAGFEEAND